jgi:hypothetical protein
VWILARDNGGISGLRWGLRSRYWREGRRREGTVTSLLWCSSSLTRPVSPSREWSCCRRFEDRSRCLSAGSWGVETSSSSLFSWGRDWNWFESRSRVVSAGGRERDGSSSSRFPPMSRMERTSRLSSPVKVPGEREVEVEFVASLSSLREDWAWNTRTGREECHGVGSWVLCGA